MTIGVAAGSSVAASGCLAGCVTNLNLDPPGATLETHQLRWERDH